MVKLSKYSVLSLSMGNSQSRKPYAATIKDIPYKSYIIQIDLYNMPLARINKLLLLTSSHEW